MTGVELIDRYEAELSRRLPRRHVDELADGLVETYREKLSEISDDVAAARAAIDEFGDTDLVVAEYVRQSPGRRLAMALLVSGPMVGFCWAIVFVSSGVWTWPISPLASFAFGVALLAVVAALVAVVTTMKRYRTSQRTAVVAAVTLILLDASVSVTATTIVGSISWPLLAAVSLSALRVGVTSRRLPTVARV